MSDPHTDKPDELAGTEQPFVQHLMELRDRMIRAVIAVGIAAAVLAVFPGPVALYDILLAVSVNRTTRPCLWLYRRAAPPTIR